MGADYGLRYGKMIKLNKQDIKIEIKKRTCPNKKCNFNEETDSKFCSDCGTEIEKKVENKNIKLSEDTISDFLDFTDIEVIEHDQDYILIDVGDSTTVNWDSNVITDKILKDKENEDNNEFDEVVEFFNENGVEIEIITGTMLYCSY